MFSWYESIVAASSCALADFDAMRIGSEDRSPAGIHSFDAAPTPTGFAEVVSDDFPIFPVARK
jgi:hypothetical protein